MVPLMPGPHWSKQDFKDEFEERAAIMEFDGGMTRAEAEAAARERITPLYKKAMAEARRIAREEAGKARGDV